MKSLAKKILASAGLLLVIFSFPLLTLAATGSGSSGTTGSGSSDSQPVALTNPLAYNSIQAIVSALLTAIEYVGGIACVLYIIWAGFLFVSAQGNPEKLEDAKRTITHALIGTGIILGAGVILTVVQHTISAIKS